MREFMLVLFGPFVAILLARSVIWRWCFQMTMPWKNIDSDIIYQQVKDRAYSTGWWISAVVGSALISISCAFPVNDDNLAPLLPIGAGAIIIAGFNAYQGYKLFYVAVAELSIPWPPESADAKFP